jgi:signal transduction histidine kinase
MAVASELYSSVFQSIPVALCAVDRQGRILLTNPALEQLLGWSLSEINQQLLARCLQQAISDPGQALWWTVALNEALALGKTTRLNMPAPFRTPGHENQERPICGLVVPYQHEGMEPFGALAVFYSQELTDSAEAVRDRFLAAISHETWSPISNISLAAELLAKHLDPGQPEQWKLLRIVQAEVTRLQRLVAQFLSPPESRPDRRAATNQVVTLRPLIQQVARTFTLGGTGVRLVVQMPESLPFVLGDAACIQEILAHLVDHVLRYARPGAEITLATQARPDDVLISVAAEGGLLCGACAGLSPRTDQTDTGAGKHSQKDSPPVPDGQDLGLAMARSLVQSLGSQIRCEELVDGGLRLCFTLHRAPEVAGE